MNYLILFIIVQPVFSLLTGTNFSTHTQKHAIVLYKRSDCKHCKEIEPLWYNLKNTINGVIEEVDCIISPELCKNMNYFPIIKYKSFLNKWNEYDSDLDNLQSFISKHIAKQCPEYPHLCTIKENKTTHSLRQLNDTYLQQKVNIYNDRIFDLQKEYGEILNDLKDRYLQMVNKRDAILSEINEEFKFILSELQNR
jgi:hypothetical protein